VRNEYREYQRRSEREEQEAAKQIAEKCAVFFKSGQSVAKCLADGIQAHHNKSNSDQELQAQIEATYWTKWAALAALFGIPVGILGLIGLFWSLRQTRAAISNDRELGNAEIRAYVSVTPLTLSDFKVGSIPKITFGIENKGTTPAYSIRHLASVAVLPYPLLDHQGDMVSAVPGQKIPDQVLHSDGKIIGDGRDIKPLSAEDYKRSLEGKDFRLYAFGKIEYRDVFKADRFTKFCAYVDPDVLSKALKVQAASGPGPGATRIDWVFAHVHNEAN